MQEMHLAARMARIGESATSRVARRAAEMKASGVDVVDLGVGEPDFDSPRVAVEAAQQALAEGFTRYTTTSGIPALRRLLAERYARQYGAPWGADQVLVTAGGKAALFELALALFEPGQEVVLPTPAWVTFAEQVRLAGAEVVEVPTDAGSGFAVTADRILAAMTSRTRAVILNSPCNPTGAILAPAELRRIVEDAAARGVLVVADETYDRFVYDGVEHASAAALARAHPQTVALVGSFSKSYAMTGWRVGYLLGPAALIRAATDIQGHATSNATSFAMVGALAALGGAEPDVEAMVAEYQARRDLLVAALAALPGVVCPRPQGACYVFPDVSAHFRAGRTDSTAFAEQLLAEAHVAVVAGAAFGADRHVRISFTCSRRDLQRGVERIDAFLRRS